MDKKAEQMEAGEKSVGKARKIRGERRRRNEKEELKEEKNMGGIEGERPKGRKEEGMMG